MEFFYKFLDFFKKQSKDYKTMVAISTADRINRTLTQDYEMLYANTLGASPQILAIIGGINSFFNAIMAIPTGWFRDVYGTKRVIIFDLVAFLVVPFLFFFSTEWWMIIPGMILSSVTLKIIINFSDVALVSSLREGEKAKGIMIHRTISGTSAVLVPMLAAFVVIPSGGISSNGIRPLFLIQVFMTILTLTIVFRRLSGNGRKKNKKMSIREFYNMVNERWDLKKWILLQCFLTFAIDLTTPFNSIYLIDIKGGNASILGGMKTATLAS